MNVWRARGVRSVKQRRVCEDEDRERLLFNDGSTLTGAPGGR